MACEVDRKNNVDQRVRRDNPHLISNCLSGEDLSVGQVRVLVTYVLSILSVNSVSSLSRIPASALVPLQIQGESCLCTLHLELDEHQVAAQGQAE
jgi:hypothetical protein